MSMEMLHVINVCFVIDGSNTYIDVGVLAAMPL